MTDAAVAMRANGWKMTLFLIVFAVVAYIFVSQSLASARVKSQSTKFLISVAEDRAAAAMVVLPSQSDLHRAVAADPYSQDMVNAAVVVRYFRDRDKAKLARGMEQVDRLGWRSTTALQNHIQLTMGRGLVLDSVIDVADALLRRQKITDQATLLMNYMELTPRTRTMLADKIVERPSWRTDYLANAASLRQPQQVAARGLLLDELFRRNDSLSRQELSFNLSAMTANGLTRPAYATWRRFEKQPARLLNDPQFDLAAKAGVNTYYGMPFEWHFAAASGYWSEVLRDGGDAQVRINWNSKYVPELMKQQTVLGRGTYHIVVTGEDLDKAGAARLNFALTCRQQRFDFDQPVSRSSSRIVLGLRSPLTCADPLFVVSGQPTIAAAEATPFRLQDDISILLKSIDIIRADSIATYAD